MFVTVNELMGLPGLPGTAQGLRVRLKQCTGGAPEMVRRRAGTKAFEYHIDCLPSEAREALQAQRYRQALQEATPALTEQPKNRVTPRNSLAVFRSCPAVLDRQVKMLTADQKRVADARARLAQEVIKLQAAGKTRLAAVQFIACESQAGTLPPAVQAAADTANARRGTTRRGVGKSSLQEWLSLYMSAERPHERLALLAPGKIRRTEPEQIAWLPVFLSHYRDWRRPTIERAYESFTAEWLAQYADEPLRLAALPSINAVRRALKKLPKLELMRGRATGAEYKSLLPFVRRDWSALPVNGAWIGDGHGLKMKCIHPDTGKPFQAEITLIIEGNTRLVTGWSLGLSESQVAVGDALRHAISQYGVPLIYYSDNGGGEANRTFDADITGIFPRLGIDHQTGIPGNPQARGIIERINREIPARVAKSFDTYMGKSGDRETIRINYKKTESAFNALENGRLLTPEQKKYYGRVPTWDQLCAAIALEVDRHNNRPHSSLPQRENGQHWSPLAYRQHLIESDGIVIDYLTSAELHEMFRPEVIRQATRGEVRLFNNRYFSTELATYDGEQVRVCFDIHDPQTVIVRAMDGRFICDALWNGNRVDAFPKPYVQNLKEQRAARRRAPLERKLQDVENELLPAIELQPESQFTFFEPDKPEQNNERVYIFPDEVIPRNGTRR